MSVAVTLVPPAEKDRLSGFIHAYVAELSAIVGVPLGDYPGFELYWTEPHHRWPYRIEVDSVIAGFALVRRNSELRRHEMGEFFVARPFRRQGVGLEAARRVLALHPGPWRITQRDANTDATLFWHRVLDGFAPFEETTTTTDAVRREQRFVVP